MGNVTQYKPGQFIGINAPGKYRVAFAHTDPCDKCEFSYKCVPSDQLFKSNKCCADTIGWGGYIVKVK